MRDALNGSRRQNLKHGLQSKIVTKIERAFLSTDWCLFAGVTKTIIEQAILSGMLSVVGRMAATHKHCKRKTINGNALGPRL